MAKKKTVNVLKNRIVILLDSSGSMESIRKEAMDMFNEQVRAIKKGSNEMDTKISLATFATTSKTIFFNEDVNKLKELNLDAYVPDGGTAMYDSIGAAVDALSFLPEASDENTSFLVVIISDGQENASRLYNQYDIANRVKRLQDTKRWTFSYLGANQDLTRVSQSLNIPIGNTFAFVASSQGMGRAMNVNSASTAGYMNMRSTGVKSVNNFYNQPDGDGSSTGVTTDSSNNTTISGTKPTVK